MTHDRTRHRKLRTGFTLIELLTVMGIMIILSTVAVSAYFGITRGAAMRAALTHARSTLLLSRQAALTKGKKTYVIFEEDGYYVCQKGGQGTRFRGLDYLEDEFANWAGVFGEGSKVFNLDSTPIRWSYVLTNQYDTGTKTWVVQTQSNIWTTGEETYGWEINAKTYLPRGFLFSPVKPTTIVFNGDGTTAFSGYSFGLYEEIRSSYVPLVNVKSLTGFVEIDMP